MTETIERPERISAPFPARNDVEAGSSEPMQSTLPETQMDLFASHGDAGLDGDLMTLPAPTLGRPNAQAVPESTDASTTMTQHEDRQGPSSSFHRDLNQSAEGSDVMIGGKKRGLETEQKEVKNIENMVFTDEKMRQMIEEVCFHAPPRIACAPLRVPSHIFSGDKKQCAIIKNQSSHRIYFLGKTVSQRGLAPLYYCFHQNVAGLRSAIIRELSSLPHSTPDHFLQNFRWVDHHALNNHFFLVLLKVAKLFFLGKDMNCVSRNCLTFGIKSLIKEFIDLSDSDNEPSSNPAKLVKKTQNL